MARSRPGVTDFASEVQEEEILTERQMEVFQLMGCGESTREIAAQLHLSGSTVDSFRMRIKEKLRLKSSAELYHRATKWVITHRKRGEAQRVGPVTDHALPSAARRSRHTRIARRGGEFRISILSLLTNRELEVFRFIGRGKNTREIAALLHLDGSTVNTYRARIKEKLRVYNRAELYYRATEWVKEKEGAGVGAVTVRG